MLDQAASVRARRKVIVQGRMRSSADWNRLHVAADAAIDEHRLTLDLAAIEAQEPVFGFVLLLTFELRLHSM
jgi:hypothetical protein